MNSSQPAKPFWSGTTAEFAKMIAKGAMEMGEEERRREAEAEAKAIAKERAEAIVESMAKLEAKYENNGGCINYIDEYYNIYYELTKREAYISTLETRLAVAEEYIHQLQSSNGHRLTAANQPAVDEPYVAEPVSVEAIAPTPNDSYELKWEDISDLQLSLFREEVNDNTNIFSYTFDRVLDVYRRVYFSYPYEVHIGRQKPSPNHHSGVFYRDIRLAEEEMGIIRAMPPSPPALERQNAVCND